MSFLALPTELRFQIYDYFCIPHHAPFAEYHGIYLSCKTIQRDIDKEGGRVFGAYLKRVQDSLATVHSTRVLGGDLWTIPTDFLSMHRMQLSPNPERPSSCFCFFSKQLLKYVTAFQHLHLTSITISVQHENWWLAINVLDNLLTFFDTHRDTSAHGIRFNTMTVVVPRMDSEQAALCVAYAQRCRTFAAMQYLEGGEIPRFRWLVPEQQGQFVKGVWDWEGEEEEGVDEKELHRVLQWRRLNQT